MVSAIVDPLGHHLAPPLRQVRLLWAASAIAFAASGWLALEASSYHQRARESSARYAALLSLRAGQPRPDQGRLADDERKRWATLVEERSFAWEPLFRAVERASSQDIELLEFRPDKNGRRVELRGRGKDRKALVAFLSKLSSQRSLANVHLSHQQSAAVGELEVVNFKIQATIGGR
jgi:hypothetical protein